MTVCRGPRGVGGHKFLHPSTLASVDGQIKSFGDYASNSCNNSPEIIHTLEDYSHPQHATQW